MRKRSTYRPKPVSLNPLGFMQPAPAADREAVMARFLTALDAMARGDHPGTAEWQDLSDAINTVETMALHLRMLDPAEVMPTVNAAIAAMVEAARRHQAGQRMGLSGPGLQTLRDVLAIYEQCLEGYTAHQMAKAQQETQRRLNTILHGHRDDRTVVAL